MISMQLGHGEQWNSGYVDGRGIAYTGYRTWIPH